MKNIYELSQDIENAQVLNASVKHASRFLKENPVFNTLELCTVNLSGSYISNPVGTFRLHSVQRLEYPASMEKPDIIRIIFFKPKDSQLISLDFSVKTFYSPKKLIAGLQSLGITFSSTLPNSDFAKLFADYLASKLEFGQIAALPGWTHFPLADDPFTFLLPDKVPNSLTAEPLNNIRVNMNPDLDIECIMQKFMFDHLRNCPVEINLLFLIRHYSLLRTLYKEEGREIHLIINIISERNDIKAQNSLVNFLSLYENTKVYSLPMPQTKLKELVVLHKDDIIFFNVPSRPLPQYSHELLSSNIDSLLYLQQEGSFTPVIFSSGLLNGVSPENTLTIPIAEDILEILASKDLKTLGNISINFIDFIEGNIERLKPRFKIEECISKNAYDDIQNILLSIHSIFLSFSAIYWDKPFSELYCASSKIREKIRNYFEGLDISNNVIGLSNTFMHSLQKKILDGTIKIQSAQIAWDPDTMAKTTILTEDSRLLIPPELFKLLVEQTFCQVQELTVLKSLEDDGYLLTDNSAQKHYKKHVRYIDMNGKNAYRRFVVLHSNSINLRYGPRLV